jgi:hypothetical protein
MSGVQHLCSPLLALADGISSRVSTPRLTVLLSHWRCHSRLPLLASWTACSNFTLSLLCLNNAAFTLEVCHSCLLLSALTGSSFFLYLFFFFFFWISMPLNSAAFTLEVPFAFTTFTTHTWPILTLPQQRCLHVGGYHSCSSLSALVGGLFLLSSNY